MGDDPVPTWHGPQLPFNIVAPPDFPKNAKDAAQDITTHDIKTSGTWGITSPLMSSPGECLLKSILQINYEVVVMTVPSVTISVAHHWQTLIWALPPIYVGIGVGGDITMDIGPFVLRSNGVGDAIRTGDLGKLIRQIEQKNRKDGVKMYMVSATVFVRGSVGVWVIVEGDVYLQISVTGQGRLHDDGESGYVSLAEVWWRVKKGLEIWKAFDKKLIVSDQFGVQIRLCIHAWLVDKCWTLWEKSNSNTWFTKEWIAQDLQAIGDGRDTLNTNAVTPLNQLPVNRWSSSDDAVSVDLPLRLNSKAPVFRIFSCSSGVCVDGCPDGSNVGDPCLYGALPNPGQVIVSGAPVLPSVLHMIGVSEPVNFSPIASCTVAIDCGSYLRDHTVVSHDSDHSDMAITPSTVTPVNAGGARLATGECALLLLHNAVLGTKTSVDHGAPCQRNEIEVLYGSSSFTGSSITYGKRPIFLRGPSASVSITLQDTSFYVSDVAVSAGDGQFTLNMSEPATLISVTGHPSMSCTYTVGSISSNSSVTVQDLDGDGTFYMDLATNFGGVMLSGGGGLNSATWAFETVAHSRSRILHSGLTIILFEHQNQTLPKVVHHSNIQTRIFMLRNSIGAILEFVSSEIRGMDHVEVLQIGAADSVLIHNITDCSDTPDYWVRCSGDGTFIFNIGKGNSINNLRCPPIVIMGEGSRAHRGIIVNVLGSRDDQKLTWNIKAYAIEVYSDI